MKTKHYLFGLCLLLSTVFFQHYSYAQTFTGSPASCVITAPHSNAYFQNGKAITIRVYSSDIGGTAANGTVSKVEIFNGATKLGEVTTHSNFTYTYVWNCVSTGTFIITAKATDNSGNVSTSAGVKIIVGAAAAVSRGLSANKGKYLANIIGGYVPANYNTYWNGVTAENDCKWGSIERSRDQMSWTGADRAFNHAKNNNMMFRFHALAWGNQYPCWAITGQGCSGNGGTNSGTPRLQISATEFQQEIEEYMAAVATRYGNDIDQLDVLNENLQFGDGSEHAPATGVFRQALGGEGSSGYDWIVWLFTKARQYFPNSKLVLNDYGLENDQSAINRQLAIIKVLRDRNLIDGFGTQAHEFNVNNLSATALTNALNLMDNSGVPTYVTELDFSGTDAEQNTRYQTLLPVYWNHPSVAGITLWGYVEGETWIANTGLVSSGNVGATESPAMGSIKSFITGRPNVGYPYATQESPANCVTNNPPTVSISSPLNGANFPLNATVEILANAIDSDGSISKVEFFNGTTKLGEKTGSPFSFTWSSLAEGIYEITVKATDNEGSTNTSAGVTITVGNPIVNLITNGEFNSGTTDWDLQLNNSTAGTMTVVTNASMSGTNALRICPTTAGDADWNVQVRQTVGIVSGKKYQVTFSAKADANRAISSNIQQDADPYTIYASQQASLTTTSQNFMYDFTANTTDATAQLKFFVGNNTTCVTIDKIIMSEMIVTGVESDGSATKIVAYPNPFTNQLQIESNGNFGYKIMNQLGQMVETGKGENELSVGATLPKGLYILSVENSAGKQSQKIVKE